MFRIASRLMVASLLTGQPPSAEFAELLRPEPLPDGTDPEDRLDESWCLGQEKEFPDLVLEIALTSGGVNKLELYRRLQVPEVWFWRMNTLEMFALRQGVV